MIHDDDDALVEGDPEESPALGSDSDVLISLGAKPHLPLNAYSNEYIGLDGEENNSTTSLKRHPYRLKLK